MAMAKRFVGEYRYDMINERMRRIKECRLLSLCGVETSWSNNKIKGDSLLITIKTVEMIMIKLTNINTMIDTVKSFKELIEEERIEKKEEEAGKDIG
ncbi:hypothetical protein V1477_012850 [Vespula maculifrons]|uniref:Uncharacterized protein n=1 Tax=Vespula maculifrons TaxID=7453 RepID=A0ABD2BU95_VESMC